MNLARHSEGRSLSLLSVAFVVLTAGGCARQTVIAVEAPADADVHESGVDAALLDASEVDARTDSGLPPLPDYTLIVDTPIDETVVSGVVTVSGRASAFLNVEVWDALNQHPPLAQVFVDENDAFSLTIDTLALPTGETSWTVFAWDSPPNEPYEHTKGVTLNLTIAR